MSTLVSLVKRFYEENSRYEAGAPIQLIKPLNYGKLVLSDLEIDDEDIAVLIRLFNTKKAMKEVRKIELNRSSGSKVSHRGTVSAFSSKGYKLMRELLLFISRCEKLEVVTFESVELTPGLMTLLGKALVASPSEVQWLAFKSCNIGTDEGVRSIAPFLCKLQLQVLAFEDCQLTDPSLLYLASVVKAQESNLDALYWNATLRLDIAEHNKQQILDETDFVYSKGLVALSLWGNHFEGQNILEFTRVLRKNNWLLGLSLGNNRLSETALNHLTQELITNNVLQSVLLRANENFMANTAQRLYQSILSKSGKVNEGMLSSSARLNKVSARVSWLLKSWMRLQCEETRDIIEQSLTQSYSRTSLNTLQRTISREHNLRELYRPYSVFSYLLDEEEVEGNNSLLQSVQDNPLILYDLEEDDANGHRIENVNSSQAVTNRFVVDPLNGVDHFEFSKRYVESRKHQNHGKDEFDVAIPTASSNVNGKRHDSNWDYWPDEKAVPEGFRERPPSRISIRPKRVNGEFVPVTASIQKKNGKKKLPHYMLPKDAGTFEFHHSNDNLRSIEERIRTLSRPTSPQNTRRHSSGQFHAVNGKMPWIPSSSNPSSPLATRRGGVHSTSSGIDKNRPGHRFTSPTKNINFHPERKETLMRKRKKRITKKVEVYEELSLSVLKATKNLEQISKHLKTVAESLSESALLNLTNDQIQQQTSRDNIKVMDDSFEKIGDPDYVEKNDKLAYPPLNESEERNVQQFTEESDLVGLVRERMLLKLKDILQSRLSVNN